MLKPWKGGEQAAGRHLGGDHARRAELGRGCRPAGHNSPPARWVPCGGQISRPGDFALDVQVLQTGASARQRSGSGRRRTGRPPAWPRPPGDRRPSPAAGPDGLDVPSCRTWRHTRSGPCVPFSRTLSRMSITVRVRFLVPLIGFLLRLLDHFHGSTASFYTVRKAGFFPVLPAFFLWVPWLQYKTDRSDQFSQFLFFILVGFAHRVSPVPSPFLPAPSFC